MKGKFSYGIIHLSKPTLATKVVLLVGVAVSAGLIGAKFGSWYQVNASCCQIGPSRSLVVSTKEVLGLTPTFRSQIGQDKWVSEEIFTGVKDGFFLDVGSADGTYNSNTKALEQKGWTGICIDPFPSNMHDRKCQIFKEVVFSEAGKPVTFRKAGFWGGITDTLGTEVKDITPTAPIVEFATVTLADILERAQAPRFVHYVSLDIEGGELNALQGFPFDKHQIGALTVEHNFEEPKRTQIKELMESHGYQRVHTWQQDDFYVSEIPRP